MFPICVLIVGFILFYLWGGMMGVFTAWPFKFNDKDKNMHKSNEVIPVGGKTSLGTSAIVEAEIKALKEYKEELEAAGPCNPSNPDGAKKRRTALINYLK